jgi:hypothetical protein
VLGGDDGYTGPVNVPHQLLNDRIMHLRANTVEATDFSGHVEDGGAHGAASGPEPDAIVRRDADGRAQVAWPDDDGDIATKGYVDGAMTEADLGSVRADLAAHVAATAVHSATNAATANRIVMRDASGRAQVANPSASADIATKSYVDTAVSGVSTTPGASGVGFWGWNTASSLTNISSVSGSKVGDYFVDTGTATRTILGVSAAIGDVVRSTSATAGSAAGNIRGPIGATGATGAQGQKGDQGIQGIQGIQGPPGEGGGAGDVPDATTAVKGKVALATAAEATAQTNAAKAVTPSALTSYSKTDHTHSGYAASTHTHGAATTSAAGMVQLATSAEAKATSNRSATKAITPSTLYDATSDLIANIAVV